MVFSEMAYISRGARHERGGGGGEEKNKALFFSSPRLALRARVALRAKYRVRPAWLIKRAPVMQARKTWIKVFDQWRAERSEVRNEKA